MLSTFKIKNIAVTTYSGYSLKSSSLKIEYQGILIKKIFLSFNLITICY